MKIATLGRAAPLVAVLALTGCPTAQASKDCLNLTEAEREGLVPVDPACLAVAKAAANEQVTQFDTDKVGETPAGWSVVKGTWKVAVDLAAPSTPNVLEQSATDQDFPIALFDKMGAIDYGEMFVRLKVISGSKAQAAGVVFRYVDDKNYYTVRINQTEGTWNLFRTIDGMREKFDPIAGAPGADPATFTLLKVKFKGTAITAYANNVPVITYTETSPKAPTKGKVGLWTKDDSVVHFDSLEVGHE